ncbi:SDH family Clp fold serine proteinase [Lacinutrix jangbogonensis]|uniref:SDH family Clp fold serine proteinase n=1 Tax=Lacinutrix jangbogonensis TaxID=1469557 RepID=UPI00053E813C|nr:serine protease [Lacinutrix jangbogonensis]
MLKDRIDNYKKLESLRNSKVLVYCTSDRPKAETSIGSDILAPFADHLDKIGDVDKITLFLYSNGGNTLAGWSLANLIRSYCKDFEVIVPFKCQSAATLISLAANRIVMTKQATLGPIDPSTNGHMNPEATINGKKIKVPVSVEHINGYLEMAKNDFNITNSEDLSTIYLKLSDKIHPLSLGHVYKSRAQIQMLAEKLLKNHEIEAENIPKVINFLCSDSGSHDYTIYRKEAKEALGLNIENPDEALNTVIKDIYKDIESEMELRVPFNPNILLATANPYNYSMRRALIESTEGGCDVFLSQGSLAVQSSQNGQIAVKDNRVFETWKHENLV